jgi:hypothetical protein
MLRNPRHGTLAFDLRQAFACQPSADSDTSDNYRWSFRHVLIRALSTAVLVVVLIIVFLL